MQTSLFSTFAAALRRRQFSQPDEINLGAGSVQEALAKLGQIFRADMGYNPYYGSSNNSVAPALSRKYKGMKIHDPSIKPQRALPVLVFRELFRSAKGNHLNEAMADLSIAAFFWACRSCEYCSERKTRLLETQNIVFYNTQNIIIPHNSDEIFSGEYVTVTFFSKKKEEHDGSITHHRSKDMVGDGEMCPVGCWARIIKRIRSYPNKDSDLPSPSVNTLYVEDKKFLLTGENFLLRLRMIVGKIGNTILGFGPEEVGNHLIRSSSAMSMFLVGTPVYAIMLQGCWKSDAIMQYIRKEVLQSSTGISSRIL
jgi:hypothetical protein